MISGLTLPKGHQALSKITQILGTQETLEASLQPGINYELLSDLHTEDITIRSIQNISPRNDVHLEKYAVIVSGKEETWSFDIRLDNKRYVITNIGWMMQ